MKKKLKGLLSLWLAAIMLFGILPATVLAVPAEPPESMDTVPRSRSIFVWEMNTPVEDAPVTAVGLTHSEKSVELDTSLSGQVDGLGVDLTNKVLIGWNLWGTAESGNSIDNEKGKQELNLSDSISVEIYSGYYVDSYCLPLLEPIWMPQYIIDPQPEDGADPWVGANVYDVDGKNYVEITKDSETYTASYQWYTAETIIQSSGEYSNGEYDAEDAVWKSNKLNDNDTYSLAIDFEVSKGDVIIFRPSNDFYGTVQGFYSDDEEDGVSFSEVNGEYTYTAESDGTFGLLAESDNGEFTATVTVATLVPDRTDYRLIYKNENEDRTGLVNETAYLCGVTFAPKTTTFAARATNNSVTLYSDIAIYKYELTGIEVTEQPKLDYTDGDALDLSAMVVTAHYSDGSSKTLDDTEFETSIEDGATLTMADNGETIKITYNGKTADTDALTVQQKQSNEDPTPKDPSEEDFDYDFFNWSVMMLYSQEYDITAVTTDGGNITPEGVAKVKYDRNITYTITPDEGYMISDVLVDGESVGAVSEYTFKRVKKDHTIEAVFEEIKWQNPYTDVAESDWYYSDVEFVTENGLMNGMETDEFEPYTALNRAMLVTVLWRLEGEPAANAAMQFTDVADGEWYTEAVRWAAAEGIVNGYGDETFGPMNDVTREQVMAILHRYAAYKSLDSGVIFPMIPQYEYSLWAENDIIWADMVGLTNGLGVDIFDMTASADRAEIAAYLSRFCEAFAE